MKPQIINKYIYVKGKKISEVDSKGYDINGDEYVPIVFDDNNARTTIDAIASYANRKAAYLTKEDLEGLVPTLEDGKIDPNTLPDELKNIAQDLQNEVNARIQGDSNLSNRINEQVSSLQQSISKGDDSVRTSVNKRIDDLQNTLQAADQSNTDAINKVQQNLNDYKGTIESQLGKYVTKSEDGEEITGRKVFKKLPQSDIAPTESSHLTNKNYVDTAILNASVNVSADKVTLDTTQTITGLKTFTRLPQSSVRPQDDKDLVNKAYVDNMASNAFVVFEEDLKGSEYPEDKYNDLTNALNSNKSVVVYSNGDIVLSSVDVENNYIKLTLHKDDVHDNDIIVSRVSYAINKANRTIVTVANDITLNTDQESNKYLSADGTYNTPTKETVGLDKVDNTSDADKPVSTATLEAIDKVQSNIDAHIADKNNPHEVTKDQVGLGNVDNTADIDKPVSTALKEYVDDRVSTLTDTLTSTVEQHTTDIKNLNDQLAQERTDRAQSEEIIQKSIDNLQTELQDEINDRTEADTNLNSKIESEITSRTEEDKKLSDRIDKEISDRTSADQTLQSNIDELKDKVDQANTDISSKLEEETATRELADEELTTKIEQEIADRTEADNQITSKLENLSDDTFFTFNLFVGDQYNDEYDSYESETKVKESSIDRMLYDFRKFLNDTTKIYSEIYDSGVFLQSSVVAKNYSIEFWNDFCDAVMKKKVFSYPLIYLKVPSLTPNGVFNQSEQLKNDLLKLTYCSIGDAIIYSISSSQLVIQCNVGPIYLAANPSLYTNTVNTPFSVRFNNGTFSYDSTTDKITITDYPLIVVGNPNTTMNTSYYPKIDKVLLDTRDLSTSIEELNTTVLNNYDELHELITNISDNTGKPGGSASLDESGKVPSSQLPSYVDDVLEYDNLAAFPNPGESGKIYVALDSNLTYRWSGTKYVEISPSLALGETSSTAFAGDRGKAIEDAIQFFPKKFVLGRSSISENDTSLISCDPSEYRVTIRYWRKDLTNGEELGTGAYLLSANNTRAGVMTAEDKKKLDSINSIPRFDYENDLASLSIGSKVSDSFFNYLKTGEYTLPFSTTYNGLEYTGWVLNLLNVRRFTLSCIRGETSGFVDIKVHTVELNMDSGVIESVIEPPFFGGFRLTYKNDGTKFLADDGTYKEIDLSNYVDNDTLNSKVSELQDKDTELLTSIDTVNDTISSLDDKYLKLSGGTIIGGTYGLLKIRSTTQGQLCILYDLNNNSAFSVDSNGRLYIESVNDSYRAGKGLIVSTDGIYRSTSGSNTSTMWDSRKLIFDEGNVAGSKVTTNDISGGLNITSITQSAYDELSSKDANTLYIITE